MPIDTTPELVKNDPWLSPYEEDIANRLLRYERKLLEIESEYGNLRQFASMHDFLGLNFDGKKKRLVVS